MLNMEPRMVTAYRTIIQSLSNSHIFCVRSDMHS